MSNTNYLFQQHHQQNQNILNNTVSAALFHPFYKMLAQNQTSNGELFSNIDRKPLNSLPHCPLLTLQKNSKLTKNGSNRRNNIDHRRGHLALKLSQSTFQ